MPDGRLPPVRPRSPAGQGRRARGPPGRPDPTGGYYQPLRLFDAEQERYAIFEARIRCGLPGVSMAQFAEFNRRYQSNSNPELSELAVGLEGDDLQPIEDGRGVQHRGRQRRSVCARAGRACPDLPSATGTAAKSRPHAAAAEPYVYFDPASREVIVRREGMRVSWFATAGTFRDGRTGRTEEEAGETDTENAWTAPRRDRAKSCSGSCSATTAAAWLGRATGCRSSRPNLVLAHVLGGTARHLH